MYKTAIAKRMTKERASEHQRKVRRVEEMKESTFHPKINSYTSHNRDKIVRTQHESNYTPSASKPYNAKLMRRNNISFETSKNKQSSSKQGSKAASNQSFERLFKDAQRRNKKSTLTHADMKCTFTPSINKSRYHKRTNLAASNVLPVRKSLFRSTSTCKCLIIH